MGALRLVGIAFLLLMLVDTRAQSEYEETIDIIPDSIQLMQDSIYICQDHFFEWCAKESICAHCHKQLVKISLWEYYQKLECEDCKEYFFENYLKFKEEYPQ